MIITSLFVTIMLLGVLRSANSYAKTNFFPLSRHNALRMSVSSINSPVRVRFAPSPTGSLHVGGARTALFNWLLARKTKGTFIIRVEDTDEARSTRASEVSILNDIKWMKMNWDEGPETGGPYGPYRQSERKDIYKTYADQLIANGFAYPCFCTEEELDNKREAAEAAGLDPKYDGTWRDADPEEVKKRLDRGDPYTVRFRVPEGKVVSIDDIVRGRVTWDAEASLGDFIILRSNGMPVYNFCVAVDDASMKITHVIRAEEHLTNTLRQCLVLEALGYKYPQYAHCSLILGSDRSKLSKRHGATSVQQFGAQGFLPEAMMNYLANLGWNDGTTKEIYSPEELIQAFDLTRIVKSAAVFDMDKLRWVNSQHLRAMQPNDVQPLVENILRGSEPPVLPPEPSETDALFATLATKIAQRDMELLADAETLVGNCLQFKLHDTIVTDPHVSEVLEGDGLEKIISVLIRDFDGDKLPAGHDDAFLAAWKSYVKSLGKELGLKGKALFHPLRLALSGRMSGPDLGDQLQLISAAQGVVPAGYPLATVRDRIEHLRTFSVAEAKVAAEVAAAAVAQAAAAQAADEVAAAAAADSPDSVVG